MKLQQTSPVSIQGIQHFLSLCLAPLLAAFQHRSLLKGFVRREIRGRFAGSFAGVLWTLIHPIASILVYTFLFSMILRVPITRQDAGTDSFLVFFLSGLFPWLLFAEGLTRSTGSLISNAGLITKVVFPVELLPTSCMIASFLVNAIGMVLFLAWIAMEGYIHVAWLWIPVLLIIQLLFIWGLVIFLAALTVFIRDIQELLGIVLMLWFYGTPVLYPLSLVPDRLKPILLVNPMTHLIDCYRDALLIHVVDPLKVSALACLAVACYIGGAWFFMKAKPAFGDVL